MTSVLEDIRKAICSEYDFEEIGIELIPKFTELEFVICRFYEI